MAKTIRDHTRTIPDYPHRGIMSRDVTTLSGGPRGFRMAVAPPVHPCDGRPIDRMAGREAMGPDVHTLCDFAGE